MALDRINATALLDGGVTSADLATQTGNVDFADGGRIRLGDSQDLQLYHDASESIIEDVGTGDLKVRGSDEVKIQVRNAANTAWLNAVVAADAGAVTLSHNNSAKLATTATGVDVTGTVFSSDGQFGLDSTDYMQFVDNSHVRFITNGAERMRIVSLGHVGITESSSIDGRLHINSTGQNNASGINILLECTSGGGRQWAHRISETGVNNGWYVIRDQTADKTKERKPIRAERYGAGSAQQPWRRIASSSGCNRRLYR